MKYIISFHMLLIHKDVYLFNSNFTGILKKNLLYFRLRLSHNYLFLILIFVMTQSRPDSYCVLGLSFLKPTAT